MGGPLSRRQNHPQTFLPSRLSVPPLLSRPSRRARDAEHGVITSNADGSVNRAALFQVLRSMNAYAAKVVQNVYGKGSKELRSLSDPRPLTSRGAARKTATKAAKKQKAAAAKAKKAAKPKKRAAAAKRRAKRVAVAAQASTLTAAPNSSAKKATPAKKAKTSKKKTKK